MATPDKKLNHSVAASSDVIYDFYCEPCCSEKLNFEAAGYCEKCQEYLCYNCCNYHRKSTVLKNHKVLDSASMPRTKQSPKVQDVLTELCPKHNRVLEYICNKHDELCCSVCMSKAHKSCKKKAYIPDISDGMAQSKEYKDLVTQLARIVTLATKEKVRVDLNDKDNDANLSKTVSDIIDCRTEIDKQLDTIVDKAIEDVTKLHKGNADKIKNSRQKCQSVLSDVNAKTTTLEKKAEACENGQLFVDTKLLRHSLPAIEKEIQDLTDRKFCHFKLDKNDREQQLKNTLSAIFTFSNRQEGADAKARYMQKVDVKSVKDKKDCIIEGIVMVTATRLVVTDINNNAVKLADVRQDKVISRLAMSSPPYDVTKTSTTTVAVALGQEGKIEIVTVSDVLTRSHTINVSGFNFLSLCHINDGDKFVALSATERALKIVDMSGNILSTVYKDNDDDIDALFNYPRNIASSRNEDVLYITDRDANTVTTMTLKGDVKSTCKHAELESPRGVAVGADGSVFVCSRDTDTVHQLFTTGEHEKILIKWRLGRAIVNAMFDQQRGLRIYPTVIAHDEDGGRLAVSSGDASPDNRNYVRLYQLEYSTATDL